MEEYRILKAKKRTVGMQIKNLSSQIENVAKTESLAQAKYNGAFSETQTLLSEEEQLRRKVEEMRAQLAAYEEETRQQMEELRNHRREQIRHTVRVEKLKQMIAEIALNKGKAILEEQR